MLPQRNPDFVCPYGSQPGLLDRRGMFILHVRHSRWGWPGRWMSDRTLPEGARTSIISRCLALQTRTVLLLCLLLRLLWIYIYRGEKLQGTGDGDKGTAKGHLYVTGREIRNTVFLWLKLRFICSRIRGIFILKPRRRLFEIYIKKGFSKGWNILKMIASIVGRRKARRFVRFCEGHLQDRTRGPCCTYLIFRM